LERNSEAARYVGVGFFVLLVLVGAAILLAVLFRPTFAGMPMMPFGFGWVWGLFGILFFFWIFWFFASFFWRRAGWGWGHPYGHYRRWGYDEAEEILRARYARGEIMKEQFDSMMGDLRRQP